MQLGKKLGTGLFLALLLMSMATIATADPWDTVVDDPTPAQAVWVDPKTTACLDVCNNFIVDVLVNISAPTPGGGTGLFGFEYKLDWDSAILRVESIQYHVPSGWTSPFEVANVTSDTSGDGYADRHWVGVTTLMGTAFAGVTSVCTYTFHVTASGSSALDLYETEFVDDTASIIVSDTVGTLVDGLYCIIAEVGWIEGIVTDADTTLPIEGATVSADGNPDTTNASGGYRIEVSPGTYDVTAEKTGYESQTATDVSVAADQTVTQDFALTPVPVVEYKLTIDVVGNGDTDPAPGIHLYDATTVVPVDAIPDPGWMLDHWLLDTVDAGDADPFDVTMDANHTLTAVFAEIPGWDVILTATLDTYDDVSDFGVRSDATEGFDTAYDQVDPPAPPVGVVSYFWYPDNPTTPVDQRKLSTSKIPPTPPMAWTYVVHAVDIDGTMCINWSASDIANIPPEYDVYLHCPDASIIDMRVDTGYCFAATSCTDYTFTIQVEEVVIPPVQYKLTIDVVGNGDTDPAPGIHLYDNGTVVPVDAIPDPGWMLDHWLLDTVDAGDADPFDVTMDANHTLTAVFVQLVVVPVTASDEDGHFTVTINAGADKGAPVTSWAEVSRTNVIAGYTVTLTDGNMVINVTGQLEDPTLDGQIVLEVDPVDEIVIYEINIAPLVPLVPTIDSCDSDGVKKDEFDPSDDVYVFGSGYLPVLDDLTHDTVPDGFTYDLYVVEDVDWTDGMAIPARVDGTAITVSSNISGHIPPTLVWSAPLTPGKYDIVVDVNGNGVYDEGVDALDDMDIEDPAGFLVIPEYVLGTIVGLIACFAAFWVFLRSKRLHRV